MAPGNSVKIRSMEKSDVPEAFALAHSEGWNQTESDWLFMLNNPENKCLVAEADNKVAGTAIATVYSDNLAWIGMVLVNKDYRSMGIGRKLMNEIISRLRKVKCIKLDATPAGKPLYESLGFIDEYILIRMIADPAKRLKTPVTFPDISEITAESLQNIINADFEIFGALRPGLISYLYNNVPERSFLLSDKKSLHGYFLGRQGTRFNYLGPLCAENSEYAEALLSHALSKLEGSTTVADVHADKAAFISSLDKAGFVKQRELTRMYLNHNLIHGKTDQQYLISGPEFG